MLNLRHNGEKLQCDTFEDARQMSEGKLGFWRETLNACSQDVDAWNEFINELWLSGGACEAVALHAAFGNACNRRWLLIALLLSDCGNQKLWRAIVAAQHGDRNALIEWLKKHRYDAIRRAHPVLKDEQELWDFVFAAQKGDPSLLISWANEKNFAKDADEVDAFGTEIKFWSDGNPFAPGAERTIVLPGGAKMYMVYCPAGKFLMGSPEGEVGHQENEQQREVVVEHPYWIGRNPVTNEQWLSVMGESGTGHSWNTNANAPRDSISWCDCWEFLSRCNANLRLPTEAEWEYACRAGTTDAYGGRDVGEVCWHRGNSNGASHGVCGRTRNAWGIYDMHGNVWEWCMDTPSGSVGRRVLRGGSFKSDAEGCRAAVRWWRKPDDVDSDIGFRVACDARVLEGMNDKA